MTTAKKYFMRFSVSKKYVVASTKKCNYIQYLLRKKFTHTFSC